MTQPSPIFGSNLYLDANLIVYASEGSPFLTDAVKKLLLRVDSDELSATTSEITLAKVLVRPLRDNDAPLADRYRQRIKSGRTLTVMPVTRDILESAAQLRANSASLKLPDAIHAATALPSGCNAFITNDSRFTTVPGLNALLLSELT